MPNLWGFVSETPRVSLTGAPLAKGTFVRTGDKSWKVTPVNVNSAELAHSIHRPQDRAIGRLHACGSKGARSVWKTSCVWICPQVVVTFRRVRDAWVVTGD